jgi:hypothetical protein
MITRSRPAVQLDASFKRARTMNAVADGLGREHVLKAVADWSARIAKGDVPQMPPRPQGAERNAVITEWAWGDAFTYAHDEVAATDKRKPTVNANGIVYGVDLANDHLLMLDPKTAKADEIKVPTGDGFSTPWCDQTYKPRGGQRFRSARSDVPRPVAPPRSSARRSTRRILTIR